MTKKIFALITTFFIFAFSGTIIFAESNMAQEWQSTVNKTGNTMQNIGNGVKEAFNGVMNVGNDVAGGLTNDNMNNDINNNETENTTNNTTSTNNTTANTNNNVAVAGRTNNNNPNNYSAVRTSNTELTGTSTNLFGLNGTTMTWIIMAITGAIIVSLIYYYGAQFENQTRVNDNEHHD